MLFKTSSKPENYYFTLQPLLKQASHKKLTSNLKEECVELISCC